jgi:hypothetical protein
MSASSNIPNRAPDSVRPGEVLFCPVCYQELTVLPDGTLPGHYTRALPPGVAGRICVRSGKSPLLVGRSQPDASDQPTEAKP